MVTPTSQPEVEELEPYKTSDTPFAAYLHMKGMRILTTVKDPNDHKRKIYVFVDEPLRPQYEEEFISDEGGFKSYWVSLKIVQRYLYDK